MSEETISQKFLEGHIRHLAGTLSVPVVPHGTARNALDMFEPIRLLTNVPYKNIWEYEGRIEFALEIGLNPLIPIECKWQNTNGSTDDKLAKTYLDACFCLPGDTIIIVLDGPEMDKRKVNTLKRWAKNHEFQVTKKNILIMNQMEFSSWFRQITKQAA